MAISYPSSLDDFTNPASGDPLNSPSHSQQHKNINDAVEALEAKVGADSSAVTTSHDYKIAQLESGKQKVDTIPTDLKISTASKGGVLRNIDGAVGDSAITSTGWIEDEKFGFYGILYASSSVEFDSAVTRTGRLTLKLSTVDTSGRARFHFGADPGSTPDYPINTITKYGIPIKPSTRYRVNCYVKTVNANTDSVFLFAQQATLVGVKTGSNKYSNRLTGNNDFTLLTLTFTSEADAAYLALVVSYVAGTSLTLGLMLIQ